MVIAQWNFNDGCASTPSKFRDEIAGRCSHDERGTRRQECRGSHSQNVGRSATNHNLLRLSDVGNGGNCFTVVVRQSFQESAGIGITTRVLGCSLKGGDRVPRSAVGVFVAVQTDWFQMFREGLRGR